MDEEGLIKLRERKKSLVIALERRQDAESLPSAEELLLERRVEKLEGDLVTVRERKWDHGAIKVENELRRARGDLRAMEEAHELGLERLPWATRDWYDGYVATVLKMPPNPQFIMCRIYGEDNKILEGKARVYCHLGVRDSFRENSRVWVEPSPAHEGCFELLGRYNHSGMRIG